MELEELAEPDWSAELSERTGQPIVDDVADWVDLEPVWLEDDPVWVDAYEL